MLASRLLRRSGTKRRSPAAFIIPTAARYGSEIYRELLERLTDRRCLVDAHLASMWGESAVGGGGSDGGTKRVQADLFMTAKSPLHPVVQAKLEPLLRLPLAEVACGQAGSGGCRRRPREGDDERDHA